VVPRRGEREGRSVGRSGRRGRVEGTARTTAIIFSVCHGGGGGGGGGGGRREEGKKKGNGGERKWILVAEDLARAFRLKYPLPLEIRVSRAAGLELHDMVAFERARGVINYRTRPMDIYRQVAVRTFKQH